ncbi:MAG: molybdopterin-dependent oxidoreductase [Alphaproteobacteria bacterium]|nr:molybdopterin-dependent oxidoreductase [Alphaproteobacteria bacterium]
MTNTPTVGPYRGAGRPEAAFCIELAIDIAARRLGLDRTELRRKNMIPAISSPFKTGLSFTYDSGDFEAVLDQALKHADYAGFPARKRESKSRGMLRGIGVIYAIEQSAGGFDESCELRVDPSGSVTLLIGTHSHGQGHETVFRQLLSDRLGLDFEEIRIVQGDTDAILHGHGSIGSRVSGLGSAVIARASDRVLDKARLIAGHRLEASADDINFKDGVFVVAGTDRKITLQDVARAAYAPPQLPPGMETGLFAHASFTPPAPTFPNGCHVCEVEIDPETGTIKVDRYTAVDDVGTVLNPMLLEGQIHGGVVQGLGQVLSEHMQFDPNDGQIVTGSFMDYGMPRAAYMPSIQVLSHPVPTGINPMGVKGAGEAGTVGALPCGQSAILDALAPLGIEWLDMPCTSARVWRSIQDAKSDR